MTDYPKIVNARDLQLHDVILTPPGYGDPLDTSLIEHVVLGLRPTVRGVELMLVPEIVGTGDRIHLHDDQTVQVVRRIENPLSNDSVEAQAVEHIGEARRRCEALGLTLGAVRGGKLRVGDVIMVNDAGDWRVVERVLHDRPVPQGETHVWLSNAMPGVRVDAQQPFMCLRRK
jgi:hypothetical protein